MKKQLLLLTFSLLTGLGLYAQCVGDTTPPTVVTQDITVSVGGSGTVSINAFDVDGGSFDNCGIETRTVSPSSFDCSTTGPNSVTLTLVDSAGNSSSATATVTVNTDCSDVVNLNTWAQEGAPANGTWSVEPDGSSVFQSVNGDPTFFVSPGNYFNTTIEGQFGVEQTSDDDMIGFVLGYKTPNSSTSNDSFNFLLFDWKQATQFKGSCGGFANAEMTLTQYEGVAIGDTALYEAFWCKDVPSANVLATNSSMGGWQDFTTYTFRAEYTATNVKIYIDGNLVMDVNGTFEDGRFGFYNFSQASVRYSGFSSPFEAIVDVTDADCSGGATGSATATGNEVGTPPFTFEWSTGATTDSIGALSPGEYWVKVTSANCCVAIDTFNVLGTDLEDPVAIAQDIAVSFGTSSSVTITGLDVDNGSTDNCGIVSYDVSPDTFTCSDAGENTVTLTVTDAEGNTNSTTATVTVSADCSESVDLNNWQQQGPPANGNWDVATDGSSVDQTVNDNPTFFVSQANYFNTVIEGSFSVETAVDDDMIGFVLGYQDPNPGSVDDYNFILFDWKQTSQYKSDCGGTAPAEMQLSRINGTATTTSEIYSMFWCKDHAGTDVLATNNSMGGWVDFQSYSFKVSYTASNIKVWVDGKLIFDVNGTFPNGRFGFYNFSQPHVNYQSFANPFAAVVNINDPSCPGVADGSATASTSGPSTGPISYEWSTGATGPSVSGLTTGNYYVVATAANCCTDTAFFTLSDQDTTAPVPVGQNLSVYLDSSGIAEIELADIENGSTDNCQLDTLYISPTTFDCDDIGNEVVLTLTAVDAAGNSAESYYTIVVYDTIAPSPGATNATVYLDPRGEASLSPSVFMAGAYDNCTVQNITLSQDNFNCSDLGVVTIDLITTDNKGNVDTTPATVTVLDTISPELCCCKPDTVYLMNASATFELTDSVIASLVNARDNCGAITYSASQTLFDVNDEGYNAVSYFVTDGEGNQSTCDASITVIVPKPSAGCKDTTIYVGPTGNVTVTPAHINDSTYSASGIDTMYVTPDNLNCSDLGQNLVELVVVSSTGDADTCSAIVTLIDTTAPVAITQDITVYIDSAGNAFADKNDVDNGSYDNCAIDSCYLVPNQFDCSNLGDNTVTLFVMDKSGNVSSAPATVTVEENCDKNVDLLTGWSQQGDLVQGQWDVNPTISNNVKQELNEEATFFVNNTPEINVVYEGTMAVATSGDNDNIGLVMGYQTGAASDHNYIVFDWKQSDQFKNGSTSYAEMRLARVDATGIDTEQEYYDLLWGMIDPRTELLGTNTFMGGWQDYTTYDYKVSYGEDRIKIWIDGNIVFDVYGTFVPGSFGFYTFSQYDVEFTNTVNPFDVVVSKDDATCPSATDGSATAHLNEGAAYGPYSYLWSNGATTPTITGIGAGTYSVQIFSSNCCIAADTIDIYDQDTIAPQVVCKDDTVLLGPSGTVTISTSNVVQSSSDNCTVSSLTLSKTEFTTADAGENTVTVVVTDQSGNTDTCLAIVTVIPPKPTAVCKDTTVYVDNNGVVSIDASYVDGGSFADVPIDTITVSPDNFSCLEVGPNTVELIVTTDLGDKDTCYATVTVLDTIAPVAVARDFTLELGGLPTANISAGDINNASYDNCAIDTMYLDRYDFACADEGPNTVVLTVVDNNGNVSTDTSVVFVVLDCFTPIDLNGWSKEGRSTQGVWDVDSTDASDVKQQVNFNSTFYVNNEVWINRVIEGSITVETAVDDDFIGFVMGFQNPDAPGDTSTHNYLLFDWKQAGQSKGCGFAPAQMSLTKINATGITSTALAEDLLWCKNPSAGAQVLDTYAGMGGWQDFTTYNFRISYGETNVKIWINGTLIFDEYGSFPAGRFGFYNFSQPKVRYHAIGEPFAVVVSKEDASCPGSANGSATAHVSPNAGVAPFTYLWSDGQTAATATNLSAGTYSVVVTSSNCCITTDTVQIFDQDTIPPTVDAKNITVYLDANCEVSVAAADVLFRVSEDCALDTLTVSPNFFTASEIGPNTVVLTATDESGNSSTDTAIVTVVDTILPTPVAQNIVRSLDANGITVIDLSDIENGSFDNCAVDTLFIDRDTFNCNDIGVNNVTLTAIDIHGLINTTVATVTIEDNIAPSVVCKNDTVYLDGSNSASITTSDVVVSSDDNCAVDNIALSQTTFNNTHIGDNNVTVVVFDASGNSDTCISIVTVIPPKPTAVCKDTVVYLDANGLVTIQASDVDGGSFADVAIDTIYVSQTTFDCTEKGPNTVDLIVVTETGDSDTCQATVTVLDTLAPVAVADGLTISLGLTGTASITTGDIENGSYDNCAIDTLFLDRYDFTCADEGPNTVILTVVDESGNVDTATATVIVELDCVEDVDLLNGWSQAGELPEGQWDVDTTYSTNVKQELNEDATFFINNTSEVNVVYEGTMAVATSGDNDFMGLVMGYQSGATTDHDYLLFDWKQADQWHGPTGTMAKAGMKLTKVNATGISGAPAYYDLLWEKSASGANVLDSNNSMGGWQDYTTYNYRVAYGEDRVRIWIDGVLVFDEYGSFPAGSFGFYTFSQYDVEFTATAKPFAVVISKDDASCPGTNNGSATANISAGGGQAPFSYLWSTGETTQSISGLSAGTYSVIVTAANCCVAYDTIQVIDQDTIPPSVQTQAATIYLDANCEATLAVADVLFRATDNCGVDTTFVSQELFTASDVGTDTVYVTAVDESGNSTTEFALVTVVDTILPTPIAQNITVQLDANGDASIVTADIDNGTFDNCAVDTTYLDIYDFDCSDLGANNVVLTAVDIHGLVNSTTAIVTVEDNIAPSIVCKNDTVLLDNSGTATITTTNVVTSTSDNCGVDAVTLSQSTFTTSHIGDNTITVYVFDAAGNVDSCNAIVTVIPPAPTAVCRDTTIYLDASGNFSIDASYVDGGSFADVAIDTIIVSPDNFGCTDAGANTVELIVYTDLGDTDTCYATVTVVDTIAPTAVCQDISVNLSASGIATITAADIDGGSSDNCPATLSIDKDTFVCENAGPNTVTLTVTDAAGNSSTCTATVTVVDPTLDLVVDCQADMDVTCVDAKSPITWDEPNYFASSDICGGTCDTNTREIPGFIYMGEVNGHRYYCSSTQNFTWSQANTAAQSAGGYLAVINDAAENTYLKNKLVNQHAWIGFNDAAVEGDFEWVNGEPVTYTNWNSATEPNDQGIACGGLTSADYAILRRADGKWYDRFECEQLEFIMEIPCYDNQLTLTQTGGPANGSILSAGTHTITYTLNDALTGLSETCSFDINVDADTTAPTALCRDITVVLDSTGQATITGADIDNGSFDDCSGILSLQPSQTIFTASDEVVQVLLSVRDSAGNVGTCFSTVTVINPDSTSTPEGYCANAGSSDFEWINEFEAQALDNLSGNDGGYGDYTALSASGNVGNPVNLTLTPGYAGSAYDEYWVVYLDLNRDGVFQSSERVFRNHGVGVLSGGFTIPGDASTGPTRMRVMMKWGCYPNSACEVVDFGEVEDYTFHIYGPTIKVDPTFAGNWGVAEDDGPAPEQRIEFTKLYPNPVLIAQNDVLTVEFRVPDAKPNMTVRVIDIRGGATYLEQNISADAGINEVNVNLGALANGVYMIEIADENNAKFAERFIVLD